MWRHGNCGLAMPIPNFKLAPEVYIPAISLPSETMAKISAFIMKPKSRESMDRQKKILIIAGPNGAGKTTFATEFLPREAECPNFINSDLIAAGISLFRPEASSIQASRMMMALLFMKTRRLWRNIRTKTTEYAYSHRLEVGY